MRNRLLPYLLLLFVWATGTSPLRAAVFKAEHLSGAGDYVVLVHGLDWYRNTMAPAAAWLNQQGYETINVRYPSRKVADPCEAAAWVRQVVREKCRDRKKKIHIVAHSMGALVVRDYLAGGKPSQLGRVVLLAAPNQGTPLADVRWKPLVRIMGPAVAGSCNRRLSLNSGSAVLLPVDYAPGILMGNRSGWLPMFSLFLKGEDDGVVSVESGRLPGMSELRVTSTWHAAMPRHEGTLQEINAFLKTGRFAGLTSKGA